MALDIDQQGGGARVVHDAPDSLDHKLQYRTKRPI
jgi:hypothetical protein